ncbi:MAG: hypothetical protein ACRC6E_02545 [Fusobacteriaceae bacterium]
MDDCIIKKVATINVYENKNEVRAFGFMAGDKGTPVLEVNFKHLFGEASLKDCKLRWILVDDVNSLVIGEVSISENNDATIKLPDALFVGERRMKVQLTIASADGLRLLNLQQFTDLKVIRGLVTDEIIAPVYDVLLESLFDEARRAKAILVDYLINAENGGNAEFLRGYLHTDFDRRESSVGDFKYCTKYKIDDVVTVQGYYKNGDGSHHLRKIEATKKPGGVATGNSLWANVLPQNSTLNVSWFGAKGLTDSTQAFLDCFEYANARFTDLTVSKVTANYERYTINKTIHMLKALTIDLNQCTLDFETCTDKVGVRIYSSGAVNAYPNLNNLHNSNVSIGGFSVIGLKNGYKSFFASEITDAMLNSDNYLYKKGFTGVLIDNSSVCTFHKIAVSACERGFDFSTSNTYITTLSESSARFCKHCIYIDMSAGSGVSNSNERMTFTNCNLGNSYATLYIKGSGFHFDKCSFDYERYIASPEAPLDTSHGGTQNGIGTFTNCWFEDTKSRADYKFYTDKSVLTFSQCYFIQPGAKSFIKAESENALVTFMQCHFGSSGQIAPYKVGVDPWEVPKIITKFCTYHKFWSDAGAFKKLQSENLVENGYLSKTDEDFSAWSSNDGQTMDTKRWSYVTNASGTKVIRAIGAQYLGAMINSHMIPVSAGEMITVKVKSTAPNNVITFFRADGTAMREFSNIFISAVGNIRYMKPYMIPQGAFMMQVKVKSQENGVDASIELEMMEVFKV